MDRLIGHPDRSRLTNLLTSGSTHHLRSATSLPNVITSCCLKAVSHSLSAHQERKEKW